MLLTAAAQKARNQRVLMRSPVRAFSLFFLLFFFSGALPAQAFLGIFSSVQKVEAVDGIIALDASKLDTGESRHYSFSQGKTTIRFFLVRDEQGLVRAALDACEVCRDEGKGYKSGNGAMICVNCGQRFALNRIGRVRGGCNPHPMAFTVTDDVFTVTADELLKNAAYFPENR